MDRVSPEELGYGVPSVSGVSIAAEEASVAILLDPGSWAALFTFLLEELAKAAIGIAINAL
jgi:hypothetical protein